MTPDLRIGPLADLARHHEREDAREIGLEGQRQQIEHQPDVLLERLGHADRRVTRRRQLGLGLLLGRLDPPLDFADVIEILAEPGAIARAEAALRDRSDPP